MTGNYRVNIFGFFSGPDVLADSEDGLSGNYGLYDAVKIFEWVRSTCSRFRVSILTTLQVHENADAFGFDRSRVTAFGESAGAFIVASLLVSRKRLFTRAILQSGAPGTMVSLITTGAYTKAQMLLDGSKSVRSRKRIPHIRTFSISTAPAQRLRPPV